MNVWPCFCACASFPVGFEGDIWDLIVSIPDQSLSFYLITASLFIMPPTSEKLRGHIGLGLSVRPSVCP